MAALDVGSHSSPAYGITKTIPAIEFSGVSKRFERVSALSNVSLAIAQGEFLGLLGPNGAGKTTLINILAGLAMSDTGSSRILGHDVRREYRAARRLLGVVPQELVFDPFFTVRETLRIQSGYFGLGRNDSWIEEILHHLDLSHKADANMRALSGGMKRRVLVAQALVHRPPVIVLDEPTAGVDVDLRRGLWAFIQRLNREGHTVVLTTHYLEEAESLCDRIAMLKDGEIIALDSSANLVRTIEHLRLRIRIDGDMPEQLISCSTVDDRGGRVFILKTYSDIEPILEKIRVEGGKILEFDLRQPTLEDVFLHMMGSTR